MTGTVGMNLPAGLHRRPSAFLEAREAPKLLHFADRNDFSMRVEEPVEQRRPTMAQASDTEDLQVNASSRAKNRRTSLFLAPNYFLVAGKPVAWGALEPTAALLDEGKVSPGPLSLKVRWN